ncbi:MAG: alcohol dehydrogenase catalytic domain-containing protein [Mycobacterium sp.]
MTSRLDEEASGTPESTQASTMTAAVLHGRRDLRVEVIPRPEGPAPDEVLIEVRATGLCGTDTGEWAGGPHQVPLGHAHPLTGHHGPTVLGHEFSGVVVEVGAAVPPDWKGELVCCGGAVSCGRCDACRAGRTSQCENYWVVGLHRHGALTGLVSAPVRSCARVGDIGLTAEEAALAQPMAIAVHAARRGNPQEGERAVVIGVGGIGACLVYVLSRWGVAVTAVDRDPARRRIATELGARTTVAGDGHLEPADLIAAHGDQPALIYEATGVPDVLESALAAAARGGRIVCVGMQKHPVALDVHRLTLRELVLVGTNSLVAETDLPEALRLLALRAGAWDVLAPSVIPLSDVEQIGLEPMATGRATATKILVDPWATSARSLYSRPS